MAKSLDKFLNEKVDPPFGVSESTEWSMSAQIRRRFRQRITNLKNKNSARRVRSRQWMKANG